MSGAPADTISVRRPIFPVFGKPARSRRGYELPPSDYRALHTRQAPTQSARVLLAGYSAPSKFDPCSRDIALPEKESFFAPPPAAFFAKWLTLPDTSPT